MSTPLPIELLEDIFRKATAQQLDTSPRDAAALQLVSRETREWVLPVLFSVLVFHLPPFNSPKTPSLEFFHHLLVNSSAVPRAYVQHIVIIPSLGARVGQYEESARFVPWKLDSVACDVHDYKLLECIAFSHLAPGRVFMYPPMKLGIPFLASAHWNSFILPPLDLELHTGWPEQLSEEDLRSIVMAVKVFADKTIGRSLQLPQRSIVIDLGSLNDSGIPYVKGFLEQLFRGPPLPIVLVIPYRASTIDTAMSSTHRSLCATLKSELDETLTTGRLSIALSDGTIRPRTGKEHAQAVRGGWKGPTSSGTISLNEALAYGEIQQSAAVT